MKTDELVKTIEAFYNNNPHSTVGYLIGMLKGLEGGYHKSAAEYIELHTNLLKKDIAAKEGLASA